MSDKEEIDDNASTPPASGDEQDQDVDMDAYFSKLEAEADAKFTNDNEATPPLVPSPPVSNAANTSNDSIRKTSDNNDNKSNNNEFNISQAIMSRKEDEKAREDLKKARETLSQNMTNYGCHFAAINSILQLPTLHHSCLLNTNHNSRSSQTKSDIKALHNARAKMSSIFPIPTKLWLEWIRFDINYNCHNEDDFLFIINLFDSVANDYNCDINVWLAYFEFVIKNKAYISALNQKYSTKNTNANENTNENTKKHYKNGWKEISVDNYIRNVFKKGFQAVGYHFMECKKFFTAYREFESQILAEMFNKELQDPEKTPPLENLNTSVENDSETKPNPNEMNVSNAMMQQIDKIRKTWSRQLSIPHFGIEDTYQEYQEWEKTLTERNKGDFKSQYKTAKKLSEKLLKLEKIINPSFFEKEKNDSKTSQKSKISTKLVEQIVADGYVSNERLKSWKELLETLSNAAYDQSSGGSGKNRSKKKKGSGGLAGISYLTIVNYFERAVLECFLHESIWLQYFDYLFLKPVFLSNGNNSNDRELLIVTVCKRGLRNIPNSKLILCNLMKAMELDKNKHELTVRNEVLNRINYPFFGLKRNKNKNNRNKKDRNEEKEDGLIAEILKFRRDNNFRNYDLIDLGDNFDDYLLVALQECDYYRRYAKCFVSESYTYSDIAYIESKTQTKKNDSNSNSNSNEAEENIYNDGVTKAMHCFKRFEIMISNNRYSSYSLTFYSYYTDFS